MKKIFSLICALALVFSLIMPVMASDTPSIETYVIINTATGGIVTNIAVTTLIPGKHRIVAYEVTPYVSGSGVCSVALFDTASVTGPTLSTYATTAYMLGETMNANTGSAYRLLVAPIGFSTALSVFQGGGSVVTIYYERSVP